MDNKEFLINKAEVIELLGDLTRIYSPYFKEERVLSYIQGWLESRGFSPDIHAYSEPLVTKFDGKNLILELEGSEEGPHIYLNAHVDTVYESMGWDTNPLDPVVVGDNMYGLGVLDMKSGVGATLLALDAFVKGNRNFRGKITAHFVSDEEGPFGLGTTFLIKDGLINKPDLAIITEPSAGFTGMQHPVICLGARGGYNYTVKLQGFASHAATPQLGHSAVVDAAKLIQSLENITLIEDKDLGKGSSVVIRVSGGGAACSVPDYAEVEVFRHIVRGESMSTIEEEIIQAIKDGGIDSKYEIEFRSSPAEGFDGGFEAYYYENEPLIDSFAKSVERVCQAVPQVTFFSSIGDFNHIGGKLGIPTVIFGAAGENFHSPNEYVNLDSVRDVANVLVNYLEKVLKI